MNNMNKEMKKLLPPSYGYGNKNKLEMSSPFLPSNFKLLSKTRDWVTTKNPLKNASK